MNSQHFFVRSAVTETTRSYGQSHDFSRDVRDRKPSFLELRMKLEMSRRLH